MHRAKWTRRGQYCGLAMLLIGMCRWYYFYSTEVWAAVSLCWPACLMGIGFGISVALWAAMWLGEKASLADTEAYVHYAESHLQVLRNMRREYDYKLEEEPALSG